MMNSLADLTITALLWLAVYLVHSTLLLVLAWLAARIIGQRSFAVQDQIWKLAMVLPVLTATLQQTAEPSPVAVARWTVTWPDEQRIAVSDRPARVARPYQRERHAAPRGIEISEIAHEQPIVSLAIDTERAPSAADDAQGMARAPTPDSDWTIDIQPGGAEPLAEAASVDLPVFASTDEFSRPPDEEVRSGGDEVRELADQPAPSHLSSSPHPLISSSRRSLLTAAGGLICLHLACAVLRLITLAWREQRRLATMVTDSDGPARSVLNQILRTCRIRRPAQILYARNVRGPAACGWWRWRIVLPAGLDHQMPQDELRALLAHELAHLVRRDTIWLWGSHALCILLPVQPLNFLARRRWEAAAEYLCDAWAVEADVRPLTMAKCLTRVAGQYAGSPTLVGLTAVGRQSTLSRRIERLTAGRIARLPRGRTSRLMVACLSLGTAAVTVIAAPRVALEGGLVSPAEPVSERTPIGNGDDEGMRSTGDEVLGATPLDPREQLQNELQTLLADLDRLNELLAAMDGSPELAAAREQLQRRLERIRDRLGRERLPNQTNTLQLNPESSP